MAHLVDHIFDGLWSRWLDAVEAHCKHTTIAKLEHFGEVAFAKLTSGVTERVISRDVAIGAGEPVDLAQLRLSSFGDLFQCAPCGKFIIDGLCQGFDHASGAI